MLLQPSHFIFETSLILDWAQYGIDQRGYSSHESVKGNLTALHKIMIPDTMSLL